MNHLRLILILAVVLLAALFLALSWKNSAVVTVVSIRIKEGVREHTDHTLMGFGAEHHLPDYKVKIRVNRRFLNIDLGTKLNTSATNWLDYPVNDIVPARNLQEIMVIEEDKVESDMLDRIQVAGETLEGSNFQARLTGDRSFDAGMKWFFDTPFGKAVSAGIAVGIILLIAGLFKRI
jgi:hypothetical protein